MKSANFIQLTRHGREQEHRCINRRNLRRACLGVGSPSRYEARGGHTVSSKTKKLRRPDEGAVLAFYVANSFMRPWNQANLSKTLPWVIG